MSVLQLKVEAKTEKGTIMVSWRGLKKLFHSSKSDIEGRKVEASAGIEPVERAEGEQFIANKPAKLRAKRKPDAHIGQPIRLKLTTKSFEALKSQAEKDGKTLAEFVSIVAERIAGVGYSLIYIKKAVIYCPLCVEALSLAAAFVWNDSSEPRSFFVRIDGDLFEKLKTIASRNKESVNSLLSRVMRVVAIGGVNLEEHCVLLDGLPTVFVEWLKRFKGRGVEFF